MITLVDLKVSKTPGTYIGYLKFDGKLRILDVVNWNGIRFSHSDQALELLRGDGYNCGFGGTIYQDGAGIVIKFDMLDNEFTLSSFISYQNESEDPSIARHAITLIAARKPPTWGRSII